MAAARSLLLASLLLSCLAQICSANNNNMVLFSSLQRTLLVSASHRNGILKAGEDKLAVTWGLNQSAPSGTESAYKTIEVKLCYAPISQVDRPWRKTVDNLAKDKTCQHSMVEKPYANGARNQSFEWTILSDVPTATYFVRAYAYDASGDPVAFGQNTDKNKTTNLFQVQAISGRHASLDIASICFSAFSVVALFGFFFNEKRKARRAENK